MKWEPRTTGRGRSLLPTPTASDGGRSGKASDEVSARNSRPLREHAERNLLPTPTTTDHRAVGPAERADPDRTTCQRLRNHADRNMLPTPTTKANQLCPSMAKWAGCRRLQDSASSETPSSEAPETSSTPPGSGTARTGGRLCPLYETAMLGFPLDWLVETEPEG